VFLSLGLTPHYLLARSIHTYNLYAFFDYAGYAAARALVKAKKKQDISSFHTYTVYTAARALFEMKKK
jgi:hypothetical protein